MVLFDSLDVSVEAWKHNLHVPAEIKEDLNSAQKAHVVSFLAKIPEIVRDRPGHTSKVFHMFVGDSGPVRYDPGTGPPYQRAVL